MFVTKQSLEKRRILLKKIEERIAQAKEDKEEARSQGDLSENFGYTEARKEVENLRKMQADLMINIDLIQVVDPIKEWPEIDMQGYIRAMVGAKVTYTLDGEETWGLLGGAWDADLNNPHIIPYTSPLGRALIPKTPGKTISWEGKTIKIKKVEVPTKELLESLYQERNIKDSSQPELEL